uniref:Serine protease n=1 Tax=Riboviria sp. TaxID=2585031 RepID=A0A8K1U4D8_9VIRU|nr:MAG: hypothetical protein 1 [Riboviria sp.]
MEAIKEDCRAEVTALHNTIDELVRTNNNMTQKINDWSANYTNLREEFEHYVLNNSKSMSFADLVVVALMVSSPLICYLAIVAVSNFFGRLARRLFGYFGYVRIVSDAPQDRPLVVLGKDSVGEEPSTSVPLRQEAFVPGSNYRDAKAPRCQVSINVNKDGALVTVGQAVWLEDYLVTALHVINMVQESSSLVSLESDGVVVNTSASDWRSVRGVDLAVLPYEQKLLQALKLKKGVVADTSFINGACVTINALSLSTSGWLMDHEKALGLVTYQGSTKSGFSGAAYMWDNKVVALHTGSTSYGIGYSATYALALIRSCIGFKKEAAGSGDDYGSNMGKLQELLKFNNRMGKRTLYQQITPDEVLIRVNGKYITFANEDIPLDYYEEMDREAASPGTVHRSDLGQVLAETSWEYSDMPSCSSISASPSKNLPVPSPRTDTARVNGRIDLAGDTPNCQSTTSSVQNQISELASAITMLMDGQQQMLARLNEVSRSIPRSSSPPSTSPRQAGKRTKSQRVSLNTSASKSL